MTSPVARYYDRNTLRFLLVGRAQGSWAIHRQLWGPGVETHRDASNHVNVLLEREARALDPAAPVIVLDLGCGVGGTLFHLAGAFPGGALVGVTISRRQWGIARRLARRRGLGARCRFLLEDFLEMRLGLEADLAVAVESFVHAGDAEAFFRSAALHLREGGHLLVADDFLARDEAELASRERVWVEEFRDGWRAPGVCTVSAAAAAARAAGLEPVGETDLTPLVRLGRPRDRLIAWMSPWFGRLGLARIPFFGNMVGGNALQRAMAAGVIGYRLMAFRKVAAAWSGS